MNAGLNTPTCLPGSTRDGPIFMIPAENSFSISKAFSSLERLDVWRLTFSVSGKHHKGSAKNLSFHPLCRTFGINRFGGLHDELCGADANTGTITLCSHNSSVIVPSVTSDFTSPPISDD
jgi:hypothetical protein